MYKRSEIHYFEKHKVIVVMAEMSENVLFIVREFSLEGLDYGVLNSHVK
jgi:hypothetical protein